MKIRHFPINSEYLCVFLAVAGIFISALYLNMIRIGQEISISVLLFSVILCSLSIIISFKTTTKEKISIYALISLFIISYGLLTLLNFRYDLFHGADILGEYSIASETFSENRWPIDLAYSGRTAGRYATCLSVTIFPAILAMVTGIDMLPLFKYVLPLIGSFVSLLLFSTLKEIFLDYRIAFLGSSLYVSSHLFIFLQSYLYRELISYLFLISIIYIMVKSTRFSPLLLIFMSSLILSNSGHMVSSLGLLYFLGFLFAPVIMKLRRKQSKILPSIKYIPFYFGAFMSWLFVVDPMSLSEKVEVINGAIEKLSLYLPRYIENVLQGMILPSQSTITQGLGEYVNPILRAWYYLTVFLVGLGLLYAFARNTNFKKLTWTTCGILMFTIFTVSLLIPSFLEYLTSSRIFVDPIFYSFEAFIIFTILLKIKVKSNIGKYLGSSVLILFLLINLPMNLNLIDHQRILHFHRQKDIASDVVAGFHDSMFSDLTFSLWIKERIPKDEVFSLDLRGDLITQLSFKFKIRTQSYPRYAIGSSFLIVTGYFFQNGLWVGWWGNYPRINISKMDLLAFNSVVFNNGDIVIFTNGSQTISQ